MSGFFENGTNANFPKVRNFLTLIKIIYITEVIAFFSLHNRAEHWGKAKGVDK